MTQDSVAQGYDVIAQTYLDRHGRSVVKDRRLGELITRPPEHARGLDVGCGSGVPVAHQLTERGQLAMSVLTLLETDVLPNSQSPTPEKYDLRQRC